MPGRHKQPPRRTCIGCGTVREKRELIRIVRTAESSLLVDPTGKANGRGAYVCPKKDCLEKALKKSRLEKALELALSEEVAKSLEAAMEPMIAERTEG